MLIKKCDRCGGLLDNEKYYESGNIEFNCPDKKSIRISFDDKDGESGYNNTESWCRYLDLHFCELCWDKENFKNYLPKLN